MNPTTALFGPVYRLWLSSQALKYEVKYASRTSRSLARPRQQRSKIARWSLSEKTNGKTSGSRSLRSSVMILDEAGLDPLGEQRLVQRRRTSLGPRQVERRPVPLLRLADADLVRVRVHLGVAVEQLAEERPARALDLRDQDERLLDGDEVLEAHPGELLVLVRLCKPFPCTYRPIGLEPAERRAGEPGLGDEEVVEARAVGAGDLRGVAGEDGEVCLGAVGAVVGRAAQERGELEQTVLDAAARILVRELVAGGEDKVGRERLGALGRLGSCADSLVPGVVRARHVEPFADPDVRGLRPA